MDTAGISSSRNLRTSLQNVSVHFLQKAKGTIQSFIAFEKVRLDVILSPLAMRLLELTEFKYVNYSDPGVHTLGQTDVKECFFRAVRELQTKISLVSDIRKSFQNKRGSGVATSDTKLKPASKFATQSR